MTLMIKLIQVRERSNYGRINHYPVDELGEFYCSLCKTETFTDHMKNVMKAEGFRFVTQSQEI